MEHVIVRYPGGARSVHVDGVQDGMTNKRLRVSRGTHRFDLGEPRDYTPTFRRPMVKDTSPVKPMEVTFEKA